MAKRNFAFAGRWPDAPSVVGGLDLEAGGTWLGVTDSGRFAAVTNVREPGMAKGRRSRGDLTRRFLTGNERAADYVRTIDRDAYSGFILLIGDGEALYYASNRDGTPRPLAPGIYGLSNHLLDSPWPKLVKARTAFSDALPALPDTTGLFELMADETIVADDRLPSTGVPLPWERLLSAVFVRSPDYGTRASTVFWRRRDGETHFVEQSFDANGPLQSSVISTSL